MAFVIWYCSPTRATIGPRQVKPLPWDLCHMQWLRFSQGSDPVLSVSVKKASSESSYAYLVDLGSCERDRMGCKPEVQYLLSGPLHAKNFIHPCFRMNSSNFISVFLGHRGQARISRAIRAAPTWNWSCMGSICKKQLPYGFVNHHPMPGTSQAEGEPSTCVSPYWSTGVGSTRCPPEVRFLPTG